MTTSRSSPLLAYRGGRRPPLELHPRGHSVRVLVESVQRGARSDRDELDERFEIDLFWVLQVGFDQCVIDGVVDFVVGQL
jgi:hypothetical protein